MTASWQMRFTARLLALCSSIRMQLAELIKLSDVPSTAERRREQSVKRKCLAVANVSIPTPHAIKRYDRYVDAIMIEMTMVVLVADDTNDGAYFEQAAAPAAAGADTGGAEEAKLAPPSPGGEFPGVTLKVDSEKPEEASAPTPETADAAALANA
eukprot:s5601_g1.t2